MRRVVVLGTGTQVGKTYVTSALAYGLRRRYESAPVLALKPIESGLPNPGRQESDQFLPDTDAGTLYRASSAGVGVPHPLYRLPEPLSPHLAARLAGQTISLKRIQQWILEAERPLGSQGFLLVETAGGVFSPLNSQQTNFDLAMLLRDACWVLVAPDALGVLHDVTATLKALDALARRPDHLVLTQSRLADRSTGTNGRELEALAIVKPSAVLPFGNTDGLLPLLEALGPVRPPTKPLPTAR